MPRHWLLKCEPDAYSIADLERDGSTGWDGVRNHQVRNFMRDEMRPGDLGIFYHSNADPSGAAGILRIARSGVPDPLQFDPSSEYHDPRSRRDDPIWRMCEVEFVERFAAVVPLEELRRDPALAAMLILRRGNRLSVTPLEPAEFERMRALGRAAGSGRTEPSRAAAPRSKKASSRLESPRKPASTPMRTPAPDSRARSTRRK